MELTYFATNNRATADDMDVLHAMGIRLLEPSQKPMTAFREPDTGKIRVEVGSVSVRRDGIINIRPRSDAPKVAVTALIRTAVECLERDLHKRDRWASYRATKISVGFWRAVILLCAPEGDSIFDAYAEALRPAASARRMDSVPDVERSELDLPSKVAA